MIFQILCIGFKQQTVCTQLLSYYCQKGSVSFTTFTHNWLLQCIIPQPRGNQGCGMVSSGGSAPSFYII